MLIEIISNFNIMFLGVFQSKISVKNLEELLDLKSTADI